MNWEDLDFWNKHWASVEEKLAKLRKSGVMVNPPEDKLLAAMDATPFDSVKVMFCGQDPYPDPGYCTGMAFSVPETVKVLPPTLQNILQEYSKDLGYPKPSNGSLKLWADRGVFLWNSIPTCSAYRSLSHKDWPEWKELTKEIIEKLNQKQVVFVFMGGVAREFASIVTSNKRLIETSHPSPRASAASYSPFIGSRLFTRANAALCSTGQHSINWRLP